MNKKVLAAITGLVLAVCFPSGAQEGARPIYADWPDTDPEWNALTNHITWCWNSLHERCLAVSRHFDVDHYINEYSGPVLVCPYQDYCAMIEIIDEVAPLFVRQDMAGEDGDFAGYFATKDSENIFHDKFPRWTPESLRMAAFGRSSWSTNTVLTAWMAITNRAFIGEVESAIKLLRWTEETEWSIPPAASNQKYSHSYYGSSNTFQNALADFSGVLNAYSSGGFEFAYSVINWQSEIGSHYYYNLEADNDYGYGADFDFWSLLAPACYVLTNTIVKHRPSVSVFFRRVIENEGYLFPDVSDRKLMYFGETLGFPREHEVLTTYENPFVSIACGDPLTYAGLRDQAHEFAWYGEQGHLHWLLKWGFEDGSPEIPGFSPIQMRDTDGDDVTEIDGLERAVGGETGTFLVSHRDESPWMYLPLAEPAPWNSHVPVYAYLSAGVITNLPYHYMPQNEISYIIDWSRYEHDGYLSAYSLNTRIQEIKCISNEVSHVKQVLVIRPRGQAVIFDFPWHDQYGFSPFGYPVGTNSNLGYVLADMSDNDDCDWWPESYKLLFPSGISHYFDGYDRGCSLLYVQNEEGFVNWIEPALCALHGLTHPPPFNYFSFDYFPPTVTNSRHAVAIGWLGGRAVSATYCSAVSGEECERTDVVYDEQGRPIKLVKRDPLSGAELNGNCAVSYCSGFTCERKRAESGQDGCFSARIDTIAHGEVAPVVSHFKTFDSTQCLISEKLLSAGLLPFEIKYSYPDESYPNEVYPASGFRVRNSPSSIVLSTSFGEVTEYRGYTADEGWIQCLGRDLGDGLILVEEYVYSATNSGLPLVAINRLAEVTKKINDVLVRKNIVIATNLLPAQSFISGQSFYLRMKTCSSPASDYNDPTNLDDGFYCYNDASGDYWGPAYSVRTSQVLSYPANGGSDSCATERRLSAYDYRKSLQSTAITTASGVDRYLKIQAFEGAVLEETVTEVDGKGRPVTSSFMDGTSVAFQDWCLHGPQKIINRDGSETALAYDPFGRVKRSVDGESGIVFEYEYDPMGRVTRQTRSAGGQQLESRWTYGLDGTLLYAKDESGHEVSFSGRYVNGLLELTRSETGLGDVVETFWADGTLKSVSGDGAAVRFSCERGITDNRLWIKKINPEKPGEWVKTWYAFNGSFDATERPGGVFDRVSFDSSLMPESSVSGDGVRRLFSHDHRHSSLPVFSGVALGGGDSLDLARDPCCLSNAYAFTAGGLQSSVFSFPEDGSGEPFESYSSSVSPDGLSGSFTAEGHPGNWFCDAPPSTGTFTKTVNLPDGPVETYVFRKFLLRKFIRRDADSMRKSTVTYRYDSFGALAACTTDARGFKETVSLGRDAARRLNAIRSSSRGTTLLHRDAASGRVSSIASPAGLTALGWLPCGELGSVRRDAGPLYSRTLDPFGRADSLTCRFSPAAASTLGYTYADDGGLSSKARDGVTQAAVAARRADGRPTDVSLPGGAAVTMTYDPAGRLTWESWSDPGNPGGSVSFNRKWHRDGRLRAAAQTGGAVLSNHVFRAGGKTVAERTDFRAPDSADTSVTVSLGGPGGRKDGVLVAAGGFSGMAMQTGAGYDGVGRVSHQWGDGFYVTYGGPSGGPVTNTCFAVGGSERMVRSVTWSASDGRPARVDYTVDGKLLRRWEYIAEGGRVRFATRGGGDAYRTDYEYDWAGRLESAHSSVTNVAGGWRSFPGFSFSYAYTAAGDTVRFGPASHADRATASNDLHTDRNWSPYVGVLGRLSATNAGVTVSFGAATNGAEAAAAGVFYAPLDISGLSAPPGTATSGTALVTASFPGCTQDTARVAFSRPAPAETPVYSPRGFLLADSRRTYRWDAPGRLLAVTNTCPAPGCGGSVLAVACAYFPDGRRAAKTVSVCSNGVWSVKRRLEYCWDGWKLAAELERGPAGGIAAVRHFVWGLDVEGQASGQLDTGAEGVGGLVLIREWRAETGAVKRYLPVTDGLGSVCGLVDADTAELAAEYDYSPYGEVIAEVGPAKDACPFRHRTRYYDSETWLYYYGYRYYDPSVTKWISKDPLGEAGGWNLTCFCGNDPVNTFDPLGLAAYLFDGTWVDKDDQKNPVESNVARLWKNYGGTVWYREGVGCGNRVGGIRGFFSKVFGGFGGAGWDSRLEWMYKKLEQTYVDDSDPENKQIDIFGFSRGAGMARDFANMIKERGIMYKGKWVYPEIRFLGVFDTVASSGLPGNDINPGKELSLPDNVLSAAHALSGHEVRGAFPLTLFADDPRVDQQWFSGVHSDTGGAYGAGRVQGYIPLYWMYTKAWEAGVPLGAFPQDYYSAIMRYRFRYDLDWNELWSSDKGQLSVAPFHDSTDSWLYWPDKAKRGIRGALGGERYKRRTYVH